MCVCESVILLYHLIINQISRFHRIQIIYSLVLFGHWAHFESVKQKKVSFKLVLGGEDDVATILLHVNRLI